MFKDVTQYKELDIYFKKFTYFFFFVFIFFPYISIINLGTDMQPYALVIALILLPFFRPSFVSVQLNLFLIFSVALIIFLFGEINFLSSRTFFNYMQLFFVSFVTHL